MKTKTAMLLATFFLATAIPISVQAENYGTEVSDTANSSDSSGSDSTNNADADNVVGAFSNMFNEMGNVTDTEAATTTSATLAPIVASILGFFGIVIPLCVLAFTGLELACIFIKPIRPFFGAEGNGNSGDSGMNGNGKKPLIQVSEDCIAAIGSSGGGMNGESGGKKQGLSDIAMNYAKLRAKTLIICLVLVGLFLTPFGYDILLVIVEFIFNVISKIFSFM